MFNAEVDEELEFGDQIENVFDVPSTWRLYFSPVTAHPANRQLASRFCCLPTEVRFMIYDILIHSLGGWVVHVGTYPGKEKVRYLRKETSGLIWHADKHMYTGRRCVDWFCERKDEAPCSVGDNGVLSLLRACKLLYNEFSALIYEKSHFWFNLPRHLVQFSRTISLSHLNTIQFLSLDWEFPSELHFRVNRALRTLDEFKTACKVIASSMDNLKELRFHGWWIRSLGDTLWWDAGMNIYRDSHDSMREIILPRSTVKHVVCSWGIGETGDPRGWKEFLGEEMDFELVVSCWHEVGTLGYEMARRCDWREEMERDLEMDVLALGPGVVASWWTGYHQTYLWEQKVKNLGTDVVNRIIEGRSRGNETSV
ncbi:hypothetical protein ACMFMG_003784 [Clarireedia jacksonii]